MRTLRRAGLLRRILSSFPWAAMLCLNNYRSQELYINPCTYQLDLFRSSICWNYWRSKRNFGFLEREFSEEEYILSLILGLITTQRLQYLYNWNCLACHLRTLTALTISLTNVFYIHSESDTYQIDQTNSCWLVDMLTLQA